MCTEMIAETSVVTLFAQVCGVELSVQFRSPWIVVSSCGQHSPYKHIPYKQHSEETLPCCAEPHICSCCGCLPIQSSFSSQESLCLLLEIVCVCMYEYIVSIQRKLKPHDFQKQIRFYAWFHLLAFVFLFLFRQCSSTCHLSLCLYRDSSLTNSSC